MINRVVLIHRQASRKLALVRHDEKPLPRLRGEHRRVDQHRAHAISCVGKLRHQRGEVPPVVRGEQAGDILDDDGLRRALALLLDDIPEAPESSRPRRVQAPPPARQRQVLAGEARPRELRCRHLRSLEIPHVTLNDLVVRIVRPVGSAFHRVEIVREGAIEDAVQPLPGHAAAGEEFQKGRTRACHWGKVPRFAFSRAGLLGAGPAAPL